MCQISSTSFCLLAVLVFGSVVVKTTAQDQKCLLPMDSGPCRMKLERYYYNSQTNTCETFTFGGCHGNDNKFGFLKTCEDACVRRPTGSKTLARGSSVVATTKAPVVRSQQTTKKSVVTNSMVSTFQRDLSKAGPESGFHPSRS